MAKNTYKSQNFENSTASDIPKKTKFNFLKDPRFRLSLGLFLIIFSFSLFIALLSFLFTGKNDQSVLFAVNELGVRPSGEAVQNWLGLFGAWLSYVFIYKWFGVISFLFCPLFFLLGARIFMKKSLLKLFPVFQLNLFFMLWVSTFFGYVNIESTNINGVSYLAGGAGYELAKFLDGMIGWGTLLLLLFLLATFILYYFNINNIAIPKFNIMGFLASIRESVDKIFDKIKESNDNYENGTDPDFNTKTNSVEKETPTRNTYRREPTVSDSNKPSSVDLNPRPENRNKEENPLGVLSEERETMSSGIPNSLDEKQEVKEERIDFNKDLNPSILKEEKKENPLESIQLSVEDSREKDTEEVQPVIDRVSTKSQEVVDRLGEFDPTLELGVYNFPDLSLLEDYPNSKAEVTQEELDEYKHRIVKTLTDFKIGIDSIKATIGPTVTLYEIVPQAGVKISKIKNLADDIALSLSAQGIRIIAPIPGKGTIGIEVPNKHKETVPMKALLSRSKFMDSKLELPIAFGKTIDNEVYVSCLTKMPHLLIAGATGQGKSVGLNVLLASLLYKKHPSELKFILVDPKKVELTLFNKIEKHFLAKLPDSEESIITDTKKVINTLNSLCIEMDNRYSLLQDAGVRKITEYNQKFKARKLNPEKGHRFLPYIVLIIDELADLMMTAGKEVETPIARLAQLARAVGIHLVLATQRPSVNVITGLIKANFPARLSFRVTSKIDSRTILDTGGAEQLIGKGDMLLSLGGAELIRLQCAFIDTPEVEDLCDFIGNQKSYPQAYLLPEFVDENDKGSKDIDLSERDALFDEAARIIVQHQQGSTSLLQRKLRLGYNRAGRLIDQLEAAKIVGPFEGSKAREVLISDEFNLEQHLKQFD